MKLDEATFAFKPAPIGFVADLASAARALMCQPTVALVPILLWWFPILTGSPNSTPKHPNPWLLVANIGMGLFLCGWAGAERIFFLRHFGGKPVTLRHLLYLVKPFLGRFFMLALLFGLSLIAFALFVVFLFGSSPKVHPTRFRAAMMCFVVAADFALTFVPSALTFTTRSLGRALRIGVGMIRQTWPRCALYVLCPPLALNLNSLTYPANLPVFQLLVAAGLVVVALLAKGSTVAFYLRERPVSNDDGAADFREVDEPIRDSVVDV